MANAVLPTREHMPRFAANLAYLFTERPLIERFAAAAAAGFKAVELQAPYDHAPGALKAEIHKHRLTQLGINTFGGGRPGDFGLGAVPGREREWDALFKQALDYTVAIGGSAIHCMAGVVPAEQRPAAERTFIANLSRAADLARPHNVTCLIEPINPRDRPNYFLTRIEQAADIIAKVGKPNVKIQFDFYHVQIVSGDLITRFEKHLPLIGHVQIAAVPSRAEPDEGEINYPGVFAALDRLGWNGWTACEYKPRGRTEDGLDWGKAYGLTGGPAC
jgi:hydroxypyruvate isomerase